MRRNYYSYPVNLPYKKRQSGSSLVLAIFILVVMFLLGGALLRMMATNEDAYAYEVLGTRAVNAAQTGVQRNLQQIFPLEGGGVSQCTNVNYDLSTIDGLRNCSANTVCTSFNHQVTENETITFYTVMSTGECDINGEVTSRTVEVQAKTIN